MKTKPILSISQMYQLAEQGRIRTKNGSINVKTPDVKDIHIDDIAHSLSYKVSRWLATQGKFYSVAQHCIKMCLLAPEDLKLEALLHDASEAYLGDMPKPIKNLLPDYQKLEDSLMSVISNKFGFNYPLSIEVKKLDRHLLESEWAWYVEGENDPMPPDLCYHEFMHLYNKYK